MATLIPRPAMGTALCLLISIPAFAGFALAQDTIETTDTDDTVVLETVVLSAEEQGKQALGVSTITAEDIEKQPVVNDISEIVRKMPAST